jgi:hypothetical protein
MRTPSSIVRILTCLFLIGIIVSAFPASAIIFTKEAPALSETELHELTNGTVPKETIEPVYFLYDPDCGSCAPAHDYLVSYLEEHPNVKVEMLSLSEGKDGKEKYDELKVAFHREMVYIPVMYIGPVALEGPYDIEANFEDVYQWYTQ